MCVYSYVLFSTVAIASFLGQFFINRKDEKTKPGVDCKVIVCMRQIFLKRKLWGQSFKFTVVKQDRKFFVEI